MKRLTIDLYVYPIRVSWAPYPFACEAKIGDQVIYRAHVQGKDLAAATANFEAHFAERLSDLLANVR